MAKVLTETEKRFRTYLVLLAAVLLSVLLIGIFWLTTTPVQTVGLTLSFAAGLSMIVLPCTFPLVFIIVPLSMGKGYKKGLFMAALFGLGLTLTIASYGVAVAALGKFVGLDRATRTMWFVAGAAAFIFGLAELKLLQFKIPGIAVKTPRFIERQGDYLKSFFLGLFLGNAGVGCPNPAFYVLLTYIASVGSIGYGAYLGVVHGLGRALPLIFIAILAILGISATKSLTEKRIQVEKAMGWGLVGIGAFILLLGLFGHMWWERSPFHLAWNKALESLGFTPEITLGAHEIMAVPWAMLILLIVIPVVWYKVREKYGK